MKIMSYSIETKYKTIEMKESGYTVKEIMEALNIKNSTQVKTWCDGIEMVKLIDFINKEASN
ncbi:hypothetical protein BU592_10960, partial [Staphylococcus arlettae]